MERAIVEAESGCGAAVAAQLVALAQALRRLTDHDLEETASTRLLVMAARLAAGGLALREACFTRPSWTPFTDDADTARALGEVVGAVIGDD